MKQVEDTIGLMSEQEDFDKQRDYVYEEAHYVHTMNAFVELIVVYGYDKVIGDLRTAMGNKTW
jgi:uncharacterized protein YozE (UPF0346 family)